ncbi:heavy metal resistance protein [Ralstonia mannitolilytica]|jgi:cobalt-zinc-cadmium efflux system membrane fusion protein|uniref:nickel/cobalt/cadmium efflux RND transporter periplasmic adaptor subunit NccB n=1 Tax=Burkholderiaceae TaxID=119060 RepID=UPI0005DA664E|nr:MULTISPECIES: nickel/cobalt/cadmium efflux RND transporter periplasmic adaptor subunit NccB [Burkholderiaceae]AJW47412.1 heavy metal resistance protein [Ralstonia mannitolilytica]MCA3183414.1 nickel/cobalt/cadmium efflux RND transporter periplasmic adaptor subunit NccB [Cupriavidus sp.]MCA3193983.1 nickel/cobalt/cadmium efflux RND transporter periplasmic adaptor subunit NccB [Cupriavidus sp.]MCA3198412.1 nickel/cobalt/cadmium efflux RND transporter periplasmic adaptor subunit NccB [Cupriavid
MMTKNERRQPSWPMIAGVAAAAALVGFGAARGLGSPSGAEVSKLAAAPEKAAASAPAAEPAEVRIPGEYLAAANIAVEPVSAGGVGSVLLAPASVAAVPGSEAVIASRAAGAVLRIQRKLGDAVRAGDVLALVDSPEAAAMAAERKVAQARADLARKTYERESSLFQQGVTPRQEMESARMALDVAQAEVQRAATVAQAAKVSSDGRSVAVVSPIAGRITAQSVTLGAYVAPQAELFRVAGSGAVQVEAYVTAADTSRIAAGSDATIVLANGAPLAGRVQAVTPTVSGSARAATVVVTPVDANSGLIVGEGVQVRLHTKAADANAMSVPEDAVQNLDGRDVVFVRTQQGFRPKSVLVGSRSGGVAQILSGVKPGEQVATRNAFLIKAEMNKAGGDDE